MRILYAITGLDRGGAEKNLALLVRRIDRGRFDPAVVSLRPRGPYADEIEAAGVEVRCLGATGPLGLGRLLAATRLARDLHADLVHGFMFHGNMWARLAARRAGVPCVASLRVAEGEHAWHVLLDRATRGMVDLYTANADALAGFARERHGVAPDRVVVVPNACEAPAPARTRPQVRAALSVPPDVPVVVSVGRLHVQKDPLLLLAAFARLLEARPDARLLVAGDGPLRDEVERAASALGGRATILGARDDVADLLGAADLFLFASRWEGMPNALLEAMAAGLPVVTTAFAGAAEAVPAEAGRIVPERSAGALADAAASLLGDPAARARAGEAGRRFVANRFSPERAARAHEAIYDRLAGRATSSSRS